jgi:hypothetical protein
VYLYNWRIASLCLVGISKPGCYSGIGRVIGGFMILIMFFGGYGYLKHQTYIGRFVKINSFYKSFSFSLLSLA